jgi:SAM-dependent methyltransferase
MVYSDIEIDPASLDGYYQDSVHNPPDPIWDEVHLGNAAERFAAFVPPNARILDVGCASGRLLDHLRLVGFTDLNGVEPSARGTAAARGLGFDARQSLDELDGLFDFIIVHHVLEHIPNVAQFLPALVRLLKPRGCVCIDVPDAMRYADFAYEPWLDFNLEHVNHFSSWHLNEAMKRAGFSRLDFGALTLEHGMAKGWNYPTIWGLWRLAKHPPAAMKPDMALIRAAERYITISTQLQDEQDAMLLARLDGHHSVAVRGTGQLALRKLASPALKELEIVAYIDKDPFKQRLTFGGKAVVGLDYPLSPEVPIVILTLRCQHEIAEEYARTDPNRLVVTLGPRP